MSKAQEDPKRGRPSTLNRLHVLDVALQAYWAGEPGEVSVNAICQAAKVSKPSLYRAFGSEDGLTCATLDHYAERVLAPLLQVLTSEADFATKRAALVRFASDDPQTAQGCLYVKMQAVRTRLGPKTQARLAELDAASLSVHRSMLQAAREKREGAGSIDLDIGAHYIAAQVGLGLTQRAAGVPVADIRAMLELAFSVFD